MSQRVPSTTALHMLPVRPTIEFVIAPCPESTELVTLEELREVIELDVPEEVLDSIELETPEEPDWIELEDCVDVMVCAEALVQSARAIAARYLISVLQWLLSWWISTDRARSAMVRPFALQCRTRGTRNLFTIWKGAKHGDFGASTHLWLSDRARDSLSRRGGRAADTHRRARARRQRSRRQLLHRSATSQLVGHPRPHVPFRSVARRHARAGLPVTAHAAGDLSHRHPGDQRLLPREVR